MAHPHALHRPVEVDCTCCRLARRFTFTARSDQVICASCVAHVGDTVSKAVRRDLEHLAMWQADHNIMVLDREQDQVALVQKLHDRDAEITRLTEQICDLRGALSAGVEAAPVDSVAHWFEAEKIQEANGRLEVAHAFIARQFGALWNVDEAHHADGNASDRCCCGELQGSCRSFQALAAVRDRLYRWEKEQVERIREGLPSALPIEHPEVLKRQPWRVQKYA